MSRIPLPAPEGATGTLKESYDAARVRYGVVPNGVRTMGVSPEALRGLLFFVDSMAAGKLAPSERERVAILTAQHNECGYCLSAHTLGGRAAGLSDAELAASRDARSEEPRAAAILRFDTPCSNTEATWTMPTSPSLATPGSPTPSWSRCGPQQPHQLREPVPTAGVRHPEDSGRARAGRVMTRRKQGNRAGRPRSILTGLPGRFAKLSHKIGATPAMTLDHLVYATPDLGRSVRHLAEVSGVQPVEGGRHTGRGTRNFLLGFGDLRYLEIIGPDPEQPEPAQPRPLGIDGLTGPHLVTWAMRVDDIEARVAWAHEAGHDPGPIRSMSRRTSAGDLLTWRATDRYDVVVPFLIDWGTTPHPARDLPVVPLTAVYAHHPKLDEPRRRLAALGADLEVRLGQCRLTAIIGNAVLTSARSRPDRPGRR